jgi:tRNA(Arg) A34 adenosine deaminase TadA
MELALEQARAARDEDEVPIGARARRRRTHRRPRPQPHAPARRPDRARRARALREAARELGVQRLVGATMYTTVEPCFMCAGALSHARVERVVWAVRDPSSAVAPRSARC